jgi:hypothetical protein
LTARPSRMSHFLAIVVLTIFALFMATATMPSGADAAGVTNFQAQAKKKCKNVKRAAPRQRCIKKTVSKLRRQAAARLKGPAGLKFYTPTRPVPAKNGTLIWSRPAGGVVPLESAASTRLILHSSRSVTGKKVAVSGSVSIPKGKAPSGGWPVISYGHGTTGIADKCAPSRNTADGPANGYISYTDAIMNSWLDAGYAVARSDYEGLGTPGVHPFLVGKSSGRGILDIVRAAHQMNPKISKRFVITGHSQGGHAALFAAGQASTWTPDLKLRGTVAYAPASQLAEQLPLLSGFSEPSSLTALASMIVRGISSVYPEVDANALLSDTVLPFYPDTLTECLAQLSEPDSLAGIAPNLLVRDGADTASLLERLAEQNPVVKSSSPIVLAQGLADTTTFPFLTANLNLDLKKVTGNQVSYLTYPGVDHGSILDAADTDIATIVEGWLPGGK